uniref:Predicted protein n=1 Tax=Hordeum vulgare subsp. vulgare TaxID=112509 RepID=F2DSJ9_HORVV|nr:predicted protein [Hordeum vulgare subsp. vulgare]
MAPCPGGAGVHARWTARALAGAFLDLAIVYAFLCAAAAASAASALLALLRLRLPCTCSRPHLPCLFAFLFRYPSRVLESLLLSLRSRFPFVVNHDDDSRDEEESVDEEEEEEEVNLKREADEGNDVLSALHQELDKERSAAASAAEEAMAMILRLQKEKSSVEMEVRQQRRTSDERCAFYENEVEELKDILLMRERENRSLQKEVESYRRLLGIAGDDEEEEMMTPRNYLESDPSSSRSVDNNNSVFSFKKQFVRQQVSPIRVGHVKDRNENSPAFQPLGQVPVAGSKLGADSCQDDGTETVVILPLSARSLDFPQSARRLDLPQSARCLDFPQSARCLDLPQSARCLDQGGGVEVNAAADMKAMEELTADEFQEVDSGRLDKACHDFMASDNDANIFDVHVVDDICFSTEVKGLIGRSFSDATMQADKLQNRAAADDLLGKSLNAIKGAQNKIRLAASERRQSLQLQLLEDIADQLQEIKDVADAGRHLHCIFPKISKKS